MVSETVRTIVEQLREVGFPLNAYQLVMVDENTLRISHGTKGILIKYDFGSDTYQTTPYKRGVMQETQTDVYCDELGHRVYEYMTA